MNSYLILVALTAVAADRFPTSPSGSYGAPSANNGNGYPETPNNFNGRVVNGLRTPFNGNNEYSDINVFNGDVNGFNGKSNGGQNDGSNGLSNSYSPPPNGASNGFNGGSNGHSNGGSNGFNGASKGFNGGSNGHSNGGSNGFNRASSVFNRGSNGYSNGGSNGFNGASNGFNGRSNGYSNGGSIGFNGASNVFNEGSNGYSNGGSNGRNGGRNGLSNGYGAPGADAELESLAANILGGGVPGEDYPVLSAVPETGFDCFAQAVSGYYADTADEAGCQVFHICQLRESGPVQQDSFLCPNGTIFNQQYFVCDWWFNFDCSTAQDFYSLNEQIGQTEENGYGAQSSSVNNGYSAPQSNGNGYNRNNGGKGNGAKQNSLYGSSRTNGNNGGYP